MPHLAFVLMTVMTWKRWVLPFQDSGREMLTPARLAAGETLYRDVGSPYGPLPAYLDAFVLRLLGKDLDVLIALRLTFAFLGVEALRRLARRLVHEARSASVITAFAVVSCLFGNGGNWPFPYSVAALEGTVGCWWALELALSSGGSGRSLLAALVAGLAAGTKVEMLPAAIVAISPALLILRPRREALVASGMAVLLGAAAFVVPVLALGVEHVHRYGYLIAFPVPEPWQELRRETAPDSYVAAFPDPGLLLFSSDRRSPFIDDVFYPGVQDAPGEDLMIRRLHERSVPLILVTNRNFNEYGRARYGRGVLDRFFTEVSRVYEPAEVLGSEPTETWWERHATMAVVLRPRSRSRSAR